jgi:pyridoxine 4-dehydrogenase
VGHERHRVQARGRSGRPGVGQQGRRARRDGSGGWLPYDEPDQLRRGIEDNLRSLGLGVEQLAAVNLRLMDDAAPGQRFDDQLAAMIQARDEGLIGGLGGLCKTP